MRLIAALFVCALTATAQITSVTISKEAPPEAVTTFTYLDGSNNPQYLCKALSRQPTYTWAVTPLSNQGTLTSIVVATNVGTVTVGAHGFDNPRSVGNLVWVTGSTTSALNGPYAIASVTSGTVFTITTSGVANATYNNAAMAINTNAPQTTLPVWSIEKGTFTTTFQTADQWVANLTNNQGGSTARNYICNNRTTLAYQ